MAISHGQILTLYRGKIHERLELKWLHENIMEATDLHAV